MKTRYKVARAILIVLAVVISSLAYVLSHNSACGPAPIVSNKTESMKAIMYRCYGSPDVLNFEGVEKPTAADDEVLVEVHAASVNPLDWHYMRGSAYIMRLLGSEQKVLTESGQQYDLIIDNVGNHSLLANRRVLTPEGILVIVGGLQGNWLGPLMRPIKALMLSPFVG